MLLITIYFKITTIRRILLTIRASFSPVDNNIIEETASLRDMGCGPKKDMLGKHLSTITAKGYLVCFLKLMSFFLIGINKYCKDKPHCHKEGASDR